MYEPTNSQTECSRNVYEAINSLEQENKVLCDQKANLLDIEGKLQARILTEVDSKRQENDELKTEIEELKKRCCALTEFLNTRILVQTV